MKNLSALLFAGLVCCSCAGYAEAGETAAAATPKTYILDNDQTGFSASSNWGTATSAADKYGADYRYRPTASVNDPASWPITVTDPGMYAVYAWWSQGVNRTNQGRFILPNGTTVSVNMQANGGKWNLLGTLYLGVGTHTTTLSPWAPAGYIVIADAVKYVGPQTVQSEK